MTKIRIIVTVIAVILVAIFGFKGVQNISENANKKGIEIGYNACKERAVQEFRGAAETVYRQGASEAINDLAAELKRVGSKYQVSDGYLQYVPNE